MPIQPLSTVHGACYADYSHGVRLVSENVLVDGGTRSIYDVLQDPVLSKVLSDEGPIRNLRALTTPAADLPCDQPLFPPPFQPLFTSLTQRNPR